MSDNFWYDVGFFSALLTAVLMICKITGGDIQWIICLLPTVVYMCCTCVMLCVMVVTGYFYSKIEKDGA